MKKKILFCIFDLNGGGAEKVLVNLLKQINPAKYEITVLALFGVGPNVAGLPSYVKFKCIFRHQFRGLTTLMKLLSPRMLHRLFIKDKYDIEIAYLETSPTRIISGATDGVKKVCWVHTAKEDRYAFSSSYRSYKEMIRCYKHYDYIAFVSKKAMKQFKLFHPEINVPCRVIYNVNDDGEIIAKGKETITETLYNCINICTVGRLCEVKGYDRLLSVIYRLNCDGLKDAFHLYILGKGEQYDMLSSYMREQNLSNVTLMGFQSNPYKYVSKMDLFVCSSYREGFSTAVTESIILNVPVITTDVSGMDEILLDGEYGLIVPNDTDALYNGLKDLIMHPQKIELYKKRLMERSKKNARNNVEQYESFLDNL